MAATKDEPTVTVTPDTAELHGPAMAKASGRASLSALEDENARLRSQLANETFKHEMVEYRAWKRSAVLEALAALETAAWTRQWGAVQAARADLRRLTGLEIVSPVEGELEEARSHAAEEGVESEGHRAQHQSGTSGGEAA
jgi:hypothetical protein